MEPLTHTLVGALLAKTRLGTASRLAPISLVIGANLPDIDIVAPLFCAGEAARKACYLVHHRGITHSALGIVVQAVLLGAAIRWIERREVATARVPWRCHLLPAFFGLLTHLLLDWLNDYGIRPWQPFSQTRWFGDLIFIVDPWLWLLLGGAAALAGARTRFGNAIWSLIGVATTWFLLQHERTPGLVRIVFPLGVALVAWARSAGVGRAVPGRVIATGSGLVASYVALVAWCGATMETAVRADPVADVQWRLRTPAIADPTRWRVALAEGAALRFETRDLEGRVVAARPDSATTHPTPSPPPWRDIWDDLRVAEALTRPEATAWKSFARLPCAWLDEHDDGGAAVHLGDARYLKRPDSDSWCVITIELSAAEVAAATSR